MYIECSCTSMKKIITAYTSFSRTERMGIIALLCIMFVLVAVRFTMRHWVAPPQPDVQYIALTNPKKEVSSPSINNTINNKINLNTADSLTLISLKGIGKGLSHRILARRRALGKFDNMKQVLEVYKFNQATKEMLMQHTYIE